MSKADLPGRGSAVGKATITQRNFILGELDEGFLEADDLDARGQSVRKALNMRVTYDRGLQERPGLQYKLPTTQTSVEAEIQPADAAPYLLIVNPGNPGTIAIYNDSFDLQFTGNLTGQLVNPGDIWIEPGSERTLIGGSWGIFELLLKAAVWTLQPLSFAAAPGGEIAQPYWVFNKGTSITPSGYTGAITVTASEAVFVAGHVGTRIRYNRKEIVITGYTNPTTVSGTVISELPQSYRIELASVKGFSVGDAVIGADTDYQGVIVAVDTGAKTIDVTTLEFFDGPDVAEKLASSSNSASVVAKTAISALSTEVWDEQLMSDVRGYARAATVAVGRLVLANFPLVPDLIAVSSTRDLLDFDVGSNDEDAIVRQIGDNSPRFYHVVNAGDVLLFSDKGLYYINIRDGKLLTPSTFNPIQFDARAANQIKPVKVEDGVVFVDGTGENICACLLDGNIYLKWSVKTISIYHAHLINTPLALCGPSLTSKTTERYLFIINGDGTVAAMSWVNQFSVETIGFIKWQTDGLFKGALPAFGTYIFKVWRFAYATLVDPFYRYEVLNEECRVDEAVQANETHLFLRNRVSAAHRGDRDYGEYTIAADGSFPGLISDTWVGRPFVCSVQPWPAEDVRTSRAGMLKARIIRVGVSVQNTGVFKIRANKNTKSVGGYAFGDDLSLPAPNRTKIYRALVFGRRDHPEIEFIRDTPSQFRIMAITQEVQL
jgi:hypothetical protein